MFNKKIKLFLITLLPFIFSVNAFAGKITDGSGNTVYEFLVDNASMVDAYYNIFNAMASFFQSNDYLELLKVVFLLGGMTVFFTGVMKVYQGRDAKGSMGDFLKYLLLGTALLTIIFSHKTSMIVHTKNLPTFCSAGGSDSTSIIATDPSTGVVVGNIPEVLAWTFSMINEVGRETTRLATMGFTAVDADLTTYTSRSDYAGYLQGIGTVLTMKLTDLTSTYGFQDNAMLFQGLEAIMRDCVAAPAANSGDQGSVLLAGFKNTGNLQQTLTDYFTSGDVNVYKNPTDTTDVDTYVTAFTVGGNAPGQLLTEVNGEIYQCSQVWTSVNSILADIYSSETLLCSRNLRDYWNPETMAIFTGDSTITGSAQAKNIALNSALANEVMDSKYKIAPGEISFAAGKSTAEFVHSSLGTGYYMAQMLPYLQMGMRAVLYAFFPFVFIIVLLPGGIKVLISYLQSLIWIELWSPTAAVLDMFISIMSTDKFRDMYQENGFNPTNGLQTFSDSAMLASVAGYLYASVPALTWLILKGSGHMLGNVSGAIGARMSANVQSDSINKDKGEIAGNRKINEARRLRGQEMISLAEQDRLAAQAVAWEAAGAIDQKIENMDKNFSAGQGKTVQDLVKNSSMADMYVGNKENQKGLEADTKLGISKTTQRMIDNGVIKFDKDGKAVIDQKQLEYVTEGLGGNEAMADLAQAERRKLNEGQGRAIDKVAKSQAIDMSAEDYKKMTKQEMTARLHGVDPNDTKAVLKEMEMIATTEVGKEMLQETTTRSYLTQKGILKKDENGYVPRDGEKFSPNLQKIMFDTARYNATDKKAQDEVNKRVYSNLTAEQSAEGQANKKIENAILNNDKNKTNEYRAKLNEIVTQGGKNAESAKQALSMLDNGNVAGAITTAAGAIALQGVSGSMKKAITEDKTAAAETAAGISSNDKALISANELGTKISAGSATYNELQQSDIGSDAIVLATDALISEGKGNDLEYINEQDSQGNYTQRAKEAQNLVATRAQQVINAENQSYNAQTVQAEIAQLKERGFGAERLGLANATGKEVNAFMNEFYDGLGASNYATVKLAKEGLHTGKSMTQVLDGISNMPNLDIKSKKYWKKMSTNYKNLYNRVTN